MVQTSKGIYATADLLVYEDMCEQKTSIGIIICFTETYQQLSARHWDLVVAIPPVLTK